MVESNPEPGVPPEDHISEGASEPVEKSVEDAARTESAEERASRVEALGEELRKRSREATAPRMLQWEIRYPRMDLLFVLLNMMDLFVTRMGMDKKGMVEANLLPKWFLLQFGFGGFMAYKIVLTILVIVLAEVISRKRPRWAFGVMVFGCLFIGAVVVWGAVQLFSLTMFFRGNEAASVLLSGPIMAGL